MTWKLLLSVLAVGFCTLSYGAFIPGKPMPKETPQLIAQGHQIYIRRCSFCHGLLGDGNGPAADYMDPRPRDFTLGIFKFRTTQSGELPTNEDLFRTVSRGLTGTGMQSFDSDLIKNGLTEDERWAVIAYIKTLAIEFQDPELDPIKTNMVVPLPKNMPPYSDALVEKGRAVFERAKCWECHGKQGRGNGQKSFDRTDDWGFPIRIRNVTHPWKIKAGSEIEDIYMRFSTGILGTPMPSFVDALSEEDRWYLAIFIKSLQHEKTEHRVLLALRTEDELSIDPMDEIWQQAASMDITLTGQVVGAPRWQNPSIDLVTIKAIYNDTEIAFEIEWDDPFEDTRHDESQEFDASDIRQVGAFNSYVAANDMIPRQLDTFRDSLALQFPVKKVEGTRKPHFFRGSVSDPVNLWIWKSDMASKGQKSVVEAVARGWKQEYKKQADDEQQIEGDAIWENGRWRLVVKRSLLTEDSTDVQFIEGQFVPLAVNAWDGSNGEHGVIMSLSTWYYVLLETPTPVSVYLYGLIAMLLMGGVGIFLRKKADSEI